MQRRFDAANMIELDECLMSNFDHVVNQDVAQRLRDGNCYAAYPGWNFHALVWFADGKFFCEIWRYRSYVESFCAESPEDLMRAVSDKYGWE